ncbi:MAG: hypothetical protein MJZ81_04265 [Bacteroidales bacterium]|nr:hypothetical protein [Bacteroidales bacterium]
MNRKTPDADWQRIEQLWHEHDQRVEQIAHGKATKHTPYWWRYGVAAACVAAVAATAWVWLQPQQPATSGPMLAQSHREAPATVVAEATTPTIATKTAVKVFSLTAAAVTDEPTIEIEEILQNEELPAEPIQAEELLAYAPEEPILPAETETPKTIRIEITGLVAYKTNSQTQPRPKPKTDILGNPIREDMPLLAMSF